MPLDLQLSWNISTAGEKTQRQWQQMPSHRAGQEISIMPTHHMVPDSEGSDKNSVGENSASRDHSSLEVPAVVSSDFGYVGALPSPHASGSQCD